MHANYTYRSAVLTDSACLSALATQVFLDTYAKNGINTDLAKEAQSVFSQSAFQARLMNREVEIIVLEVGEYLVGFVDVCKNSRCPVQSVTGFEILRLYIQAPFQSKGMGRQLMALAEDLATAVNVDTVWLTAWSGNTPALLFYPRLGYEDVGVTQHTIEGKQYENRVFAKRLTAR